MTPPTVELSCVHCSWRTVSSEYETIKRLRSVGMLRHQAEPDEDLLAELLPLAAARMTCPACGAIGLQTGDGGDGGDADEWSESGWHNAVACEICRQPIQPERLEAVPGATRCAACQTEAEAGREPEELDYCPKCGSLMMLRVGNAGGVTRYKLFCTGSPPCRL